MPVAWRDKITYSLSDRSGVLRFKAFDIVHASEHVEAALRGLLVGCCLAEIDPSDIRELSFPDDEQCTHDIAAAAAAVVECQSMFCPVNQ